MIYELKIVTSSFVHKHHIHSVFKAVNVQKNCYVNDWYEYGVHLQTCFNGTKAFRNRVPVTDGEESVSLNGIAFI